MLEVRLKGGGERERRTRGEVGIRETGDGEQRAENEMRKRRRATRRAAQLSSLFSECSAAIRIWVMTS
jgi:hypothetical protein